MSQPHGAAGVTQFVTPRIELRKAESHPVSIKDEVPDTPSVQNKQEEATQPTPLVPTMGLPAHWFTIKKALFANPRPPRLSKKEVRMRRANDSIFYEQEITGVQTHLVIAFVGVKGAAATTTTMVHVASIFADDTRALVYGADFNPASGTAGARLGKDFGETTSIQEFAKIYEEVKGSRRLVNEKLRQTRYGVRVLSADDYTTLPGEQYGTTTAKMLDVLDDNCDFLMLDTPNDITTPAARAVLAKADMIVFTANVVERDSLRLLRVSMDTARKLGHEEKVKNSIVVISNVPKGAVLSDYEKYLGRVNLRHEVTAPLVPGEFSGQMHLIPHDPVIALNGQVDLDPLHWSTLQSYRDTIVSIFEQSLEVQSQTTLTALGRS